MNLPDEMDADLLEILGRPNFWCAPIAHAMRAAGMKIAKKAEDEQAHVLFKLLSLYAEHGADWREHGSIWLKDLAGARRAAEAPGQPEPAQRGDCHGD